MSWNFKYFADPDHAFGAEKKACEFLNRGRFFPSEVNITKSGEGILVFWVGEKHEDPEDASPLTEKDLDAYAESIGAPPRR